MVYHFLGKANWAMIVTVGNAVCLSLPSVTVCKYEIVFIDLVLMEDQFFFDFYQQVLKSNKAIDSYWSNYQTNGTRILIRSDLLG